MKNMTSKIININQNKITLNNIDPNIVTGDGSKLLSVDNTHKISYNYFKGGYNYFYEAQGIILVNGVTLLVKMSPNGKNSIFNIHFKYVAGSFDCMETIIHFLPTLKTDTATPYYEISRLRYEESILNYVSNTDKKLYVGYMNETPDSATVGFAIYFNSSATVTVAANIDNVFIRDIKETLDYDNLFNISIISGKTPSQIFNVLEEKMPVTFDDRIQNYLNNSYMAMNKDTITSNSK